MHYEPPTIPNGSTCDPYELAPGVIGYAIEHEGRVYIPLITAQREGSGDVGRFLDSLSPRCCVPNVTSERLRGMLERRRWGLEFDETGGDPVDVWVRPIEVMIAWR